MNQCENFDIKEKLKNSCSEIYFFSNKNDGNNNSQNNSTGRDCSEFDLEKPFQSLIDSLNNLKI